MAAVSLIFFNVAKSYNIIYGVPTSCITMHILQLFDFDGARTIDAVEKKIDRRIRKREMN